MSVQNRFCQKEKKNRFHHLEDFLPEEEDRMPLDVKTHPKNRLDGWNGRLSNGLYFLNLKIP